MPTFEPLPAHVSFPELEERVLAFWEREHIFEQGLEERRDANPFVFYEGPPTANGLPGVHHILARSFKDCFLRYQQMLGRRVERRGGWDTHGLPVE
ncbi:Aminoacyl-tRNA synthetase, class Ia domain protein, partial [mine drainage metagenome]